MEKVTFVNDKLVMHPKDTIILDLFALKTIDSKRKSKNDSRLDEEYPVKDLNTSF